MIPYFLTSFTTITMFYIIYCFWASYFFACLRGVARSLGTQYFVSLFACAGVARPLVNHIHHLYFHGFLSGFPISSSITNCIIIVIISGSSMSSGSGSGSSSSSSSSSSNSNSNSTCCCYCCCCCCCCWVLTLGSMDFLRCCAWACAGMRAGLRGLVRGGCAFRGFGWHSKYDVFHVFLVWGCA